VAWPEPELAVGVAAGVLRLPDELLPDVPELDDFDEDEPVEDEQDDFAACVPCAAAWDEEAVTAPGRL
jgi:hypothetical protein